MADSDLETAVEASLAEGLGTSVSRYRIGNREVERDPQKAKVDFDILMKLRGLQSPKRGFSVGKIDRAG